MRLTKNTRKRCHSSAHGDGFMNIQNRAIDQYELITNTIQITWQFVSNHS
ncbi:Uncharacterized protein ChrSV_4202 [Chromobacterium vaccinii]|nr:Uncharacterized protein ChrSW_4202 [Chromobacterium vaccinii]QND91659.1 Uncharacterized protein ChrSV_4202 [Chromobacterium vaccinii]